MDESNGMHTLRITMDSAKSTDTTMDREGVTWHCQERSSQHGSRALRLPKTADVSHMTAAMKDGVLTVTVPKHGAAEASQRKRITVT